MEDWKEQVRQLARELADAPQIRREEIPDLEIYMDQLTTYLDRRLGFYNREEGVPFVTRSMVNNYSKAGVLPPPVSKRYNRVHVMVLSLVCQLKRLFTIQDLGRLLAPTGGEEQGADALYRLFLTAQRQAFEEAPALVDPLLDAAGEGDEALAKAALVAQLAVRAQRDLLLAQRVLDTMEPGEGKKQNEKKKR